MATSEISFETALKRLEEIVKRLEEEPLPLDEALARFTEGKELLSLCLKKLDAAEQQLKVLASE